MKEKVVESSGGVDSSDLTYITKERKFDMINCDNTRSGREEDGLFRKREWWMRTVDYKLLIPGDSTDDRNSSYNMNLKEPKINVDYFCEKDI